MENNELQHWGVKGMKWGIRRYQNKDGTLTEAGKKRYAKEEEAAKKKAEQEEAARKQEHDYAIADRLYEEHARPTIRACNSAYNNYKAGKREDAMRDLDEAGAHLKKIEEGAKKAYNTDSILKSDLYLEPKWAYESLLEDVTGQRSEFIDKEARRVKHSDEPENFDDYLAHWGVKGMKWGIRRYQNKDGTLTPAGKKRYAEEMARLDKESKILKNKQRTKAQLDKLDAKRREIEEQKRSLSGKTDKPKIAKPASGKKKLSDLSNEELEAKIARLKLEKSYKELVNEINNSSQSNAGNKGKGQNNTVKNVSKGKAFVDHVGKNILAPAATDVSKEYVKKALKEGMDRLINELKSSEEDKDKNK